MLRAHDHEIGPGGRGRPRLRRAPRCNPPETYWPLGRFWKLFGKRFLFDHHDLSPEFTRPSSAPPAGWPLAGLRYLERKTFETADLVITTNESHQQIAVERGGTPSADVYVVAPALTWSA